MAFTSTDLINIDAAMVEFAVSGIASVSIAGQSVTAKSLDELRRLREMVNAELVAATDRPGLGLRFQRIKPVYY